MGSVATTTGSTQAGSTTLGPTSLTTTPHSSGPPRTGSPSTRPIHLNGESHPDSLLPSLDVVSWRVPLPWGPLEGVDVDRLGDARVGEGLSDLLSGVPFTACGSSLGFVGSPRLVRSFRGDGTPDAVSVVAGAAFQVVLTLPPPPPEGGCRRRTLLLKLGLARAFNAMSGAGCAGEPDGNSAAWAPWWGVSPAGFNWLGMLVAADLWVGELIPGVLDLLGVDVPLCVEAKAVIRCIEAAVDATVGSDAEALPALERAAESIGASLGAGIVKRRASSGMVIVTRPKTARAVFYTKMLQAPGGPPWVVLRAETRRMLTSDGLRRAAADGDLVRVRAEVEAAWAGLGCALGEALAGGLSPAQEAAVLSSPWAGAHLEALRAGGPLPRAVLEAEGFAGLRGAGLVLPGLGARGRRRVHLDARRLLLSGAAPLRSPRARRGGQGGNGDMGAGRREVGMGGTDVEVVAGSGTVPAWGGCPPAPGFSPSEPLMAVGEVAAWLGVTVAAVRQRVARDGLPVVRLGRRSVRFDRRAVSRWLEERNPAAPSPGGSGSRYCPLPPPLPFGDGGDGTGEGGAA